MLSGLDSRKPATGVGKADGPVERDVMPCGIAKQPRSSSTYARLLQLLGSELRPSPCHLSLPAHLLYSPGHGLQGTVGQNTSRYLVEGTVRVPEGHLDGGWVVLFEVGSTVVLAPCQMPW